MRRYAGVAIVGLFAVVVGWQLLKYQGHKSDFASTEIPINDLYERNVQSTFNNRCVVCHSCNNAPCQLNLTSYQGLRRGASKTLVYQGERRQSITPSRLDIDAMTEQGWRVREFFPVVDENYSENSPLLQSLNQKITRSSDPSFSAWADLAKLPPVLESHTCPNQEEVTEFYKAQPHAAMPYGLPAISSGEMRKLKDWIGQGAPPPRPQIRITAAEKAALVNWEQFLNSSRDEGKLVSRYIYEHLSLAHIHFSETPQQFFRLVRSRASCEEGVLEIPSRRPNDDLKVDFSYCFKPIQQTIVEKTHLPYLMDLKKLQWTHKNFFSQNWRVENMPDYSPERSANPFETFESIPVEARYRFLIEDAHYHVSAFIKGPVCNGTKAVNAIDEHFFVFFYDPKFDLSVKDPAFHKKSQALLSLPAEKGSDASRIGMATYFAKYPILRNQYRKIREEALKKNYPEGLSLNQIWNGENSNDNSVLTVLRHGDNSAVLKGARGDASYSAFVLDYALFERLVYNLVVGFDVYGNFTHQLHTRIYMGMIRMEAENNFLDFLPSSTREVLRKEWYASKFFGRLEKKLIDRKVPDDNLSQIEIPSTLGAPSIRLAFYQKIFGERLSYMVSRYPDSINWRRLNFKRPGAEESPLEGESRILGKLVSRNLSEVATWVTRFPDAALLVVKRQQAVSRVYTIIRNKRVKELGTILFEELMRKPEEDELMIFKGLAASYPNYFFIVQESDVDAFTNTVMVGDWSTVKTQWGLERTRPDFWVESDKIQDHLKNTMGLQAGVVDYTRYDLWTK